MRLRLSAGLSTRTPPRPRGQAEEDEDATVLPPPSNVYVDEYRKVLLYTHDEKPLIRRTGF